MDLLHKPSAANGLGLILTHGASSDANTPLLVHLAEAFVRTGWWVMRYNLPLRQRKGASFSPAAQAEDREGLRTAVAELRGLMGGRICLGGHSYGGRQASMLAAESPGLVEALLLLSYPLHPPKKPTQLRTDHFSQLRTSALFVHGVKDEFATSAEMQAAVRLIPAKTTALESIEKAGHDLNKGSFDLQERIVAPFYRLVMPS